MPLPFILWGAAAVIAGYGVKKGIDAKDDFDTAKWIGNSARKKYEDAESSLQVLREETNSEFISLGKIKLSIFKDQINHLVSVVKKYKHATSKLRNFNVNISTDQLKEMERLVLASLEIEKGLGAGATTGVLAAMGAYGGVGMLATASTGTAIAGLSGAAATNATLAWLGAGSLASGGFGMAGGAIALGGIVLAPALAVMGFMMASKAEEALTQAHDYAAKVDIAIAQIDTIKIVLIALKENARELGSALNEMVKRFDIVKVNDNNDVHTFESMFVIGMGLKNLLDISIMDESGAATKNIKTKISGYMEI